MKRCPASRIIREKSYPWWDITSHLWGWLARKRGNKCWRGYREKGILVYCWGKYKLVQPLWKTGFPGGSDSKETACNAGDLGSIPGSRRSPGEGNGNPLQCSCLENAMVREAWQAIVQRIAELDMTEGLSMYTRQNSQRLGFVKTQPWCSFCCCFFYPSHLLGR